MNRHAQDPRWLTARFDSVCQCGQPVKRGGQIFYYPKGKTALCETCGQAASAEFHAAVADEAMMNGQNW